MKLALMSYSLSSNFGDEVQTLAIKQHINQDQFAYVDRDFLSSYVGPEVVMVMNGWFSHRKDGFPPSKKIVPIFFGFHIDETVAEAYRQHVDYFKAHEPIGCRDIATQRRLESWGVKAYFSGCPTLTFPSRKLENTPQLLLSVDTRFKHVAKPIRRQFNYITHKASASLLSNATKMQTAFELLEIYRTQAKAVITSRIHCALPCAAMGVPVLYTGPVDYRTKIIHEVGISCKSAGFFNRVNNGDIPTTAVSYTELKSKITTGLRERIHAFGVNLSPLQLI